MSAFAFRRRELDFQLHELLAVSRFCAHPRYAMHDRATFDASFDAAETLAAETFANHVARADAEEPRIVEGKVRLIPEVKAAIDAYIQAGFMGSAFDLDEGGSQLPYTVSQGLAWIFTAANVGTVAYPFLTMAAANLLRAHGSPAQKQRFLPAMIAGRWFGTMCLSEPHAGSSLGDLRCRAEPTGEGDYRLSGSKMWISAGEHELSENIIHFVLARISGAPAGTRGISLFLVPRYRLDAQGQPGVHNDIALAGLNHKMGYRGTTNCLLNFGERGDCRGELVGAPGQGLACMFHMMNEARIGVGLNAAVLAHTGYLHSLDYARQRPQGRRPGERDPASPPVMISEHADVRRMLLQQKALSEGALALCLYGASLVDEQAISREPAEREALGQELEILTPMIKAWSSHYGLEANYWGLQTLGGYGYTRDYPLERIYRDNRLNPIHEGTNGIQALDLLGRKVVAGQGAAFRRLMARIEASRAEAGGEPLLAELVDALGQAQQRVIRTTLSLGSVLARGEVERGLANAWVYLQMLGTLTVAWMWLRQARCAQAGLAGGATADADYYQGKLLAARFFYRWELPQIERQAALLDSLDDTVLHCRSTQL
ncbi:MAG TPA: acyl-CoA dehydrogenase [Nevskiaceae bacterium]|nr:acyl-CoA dehydrogenase [Nevskiaceae bacterium]